MNEIKDELQFMVEAGIQNITNAITLSESEPLALAIKRTVIKGIDACIEEEFGRDG